MIIVEIHSGLGNQLFQYAFARNISIKRDIQLKLSLSSLQVQEKKLNRSIYRLKHYNIIEDLATDDEVALLKRTEYTSIPYRIIKKLSGRRLRFYRNNAFHVDHSSYNKDKIKLEKNHDIYLTGYWGDYRYFSENNDQLIKELRLRETLLQQYAEHEKQIKNTLSIGIHVRRTDYIKWQHLFNVLDMEYYRTAIKMMNQKLGDQTIFYLFTDDPEWTQQNFKQLKEKYRIVFMKEQSFENDYLNLHLMSCCKHFIIANSTFSWWGAWLIENKDKIIIAPKYWFNNRKYQKDYENGSLVPKEWIKI